MPLSAIYQGERIESIALNPEEWAELKRSYRHAGLTMACGNEGVPKTSRLGTPFFAHKPGADCQVHVGGLESFAHLATKATVARAAREAGWDAVIEYPATDRSWIADVLVSKGDRRIAIEAQWSPQSQAEFERRHARYVAAGIECVWLVAEANEQNAATVPHFVITGGADQQRLRLPQLGSQHDPELGEGIMGVLRDEIQQTVELVATTAMVRTQMVKCWNCHRWLSIWMVDELVLESRCRGNLTLTWLDPWPGWMPERHEQALEAPIRDAFSQSDLPAAAVLRMKHSEVMDTNYIALNCPHCGYVQGDGKLSWGIAERYQVPLYKGIRLPFANKIRAQAHWCRDLGRGRCIQEHAPDGARPSGPIYPPQAERVEIWRYGSTGTAPEPLPPRGSRPRRRQ